MTATAAARASLGKALRQHALIGSLLSAANSQLIAAETGGGTPGSEWAETGGINLAAARQAAADLAGKLESAMAELPQPPRSDEEYNQAAEFLPPEGADGLPAVRVAGALVFAYIKDGILRVSVDLEEVEDGLTRDDEQATVPMEIIVGGDAVFSDIGGGYSPVSYGPGPRRSA